ncbi:hypothetical protein FQR65_LT15589 [Abscondita terminalis]|nr:hypothetical protein FQR65_LT15589 [Abscondita terminalis]
MNLLNYQCKTKGTISISKSSLIKLPLSCSIKFNNQTYVNNKDEVFKEMNVPKISLFLTENTVNEKPFELTQLNMNNNFKNQIIKDEIMQQNEIPLKYKISHYLIISIVITFIIVIIYKNRNKILNKFKKQKTQSTPKLQDENPEDGLLSHPGGVISKNLSIHQEVSAMSDVML